VADDAYGTLLSQVRILLDRVAGCAPPPDTLSRLADQVAGVNDVLARHQVPVSRRWDGIRLDLPGRGHLLLPPYIVDLETEALLRARVTFSRLHLGGAIAVHGGAVPLLFDDLLGRLVNQRRSGTVRTAFMHVNYRKITPIEVELDVEVTLSRVERHKRFVTGRIFDPSGDVLCDSEALFVVVSAG